MSKDDAPFNGVTTESLVNELSRRMKLTRHEALKFKDLCMTRCGYTMRPSYVWPDDDERGREREHDEDDEYPF